MNNKLLVKNALIVTMNQDSDVFQGDILIDNKNISSIGPSLLDKQADIFDASGYIVTPGFIQTHVHLCQTLFRNLADDLSLLDWLQIKIWPFESRHTAESLRASARLGIAELIRGGTTTILDMGTVNHQDVIFEELAQSGMRAIAGKTMMDYGEMPAGLKEKTSVSIEESLRLLNKWHNFDEGRLKYAFAPRFALSCSDELMKETAKLAAENGVIYHTHASENRDETRLIQERFGVSNIMLFDKLGAADKNLCLAHCVWSTEEERQLLKERSIKVMHCPSANLKLGSGIAPIPDYLEKGITVSLGSDGPPCNNNLDIFNEMRQAALIQKPEHGPQAMPAETVLKTATVYGALTLGLEKEIGSIETGKRADLTFIKNDQVHSIPYENVYSKILYSANSRDVNHVMINGGWVLKDSEFQTLNAAEIVEDVKNISKNFIQNEL